MKIVVRIFVTLFSLVMLKACFGLFYLKVAELTPNELKWVYNKKDLERVMVSTTGEHAKVFTYSHGIDNAQNPLQFNWHGGSGDYKDAGAWYDFKIRSNRIDKEGFLHIIKYAANDSFRIQSRIGNLYKNNLTLSDVKTVTVGNHEFKDCIIVDECNGNHTLYTNENDSNNVSKFIISKQYGPIYLRLQSGDEYFRQFK